LEGLVVRELDHVGFGREEGLVDVHLGVGVDAVVADVEELDDLRLWELLEDRLTRLLVLDELAGNLTRKAKNISKTRNAIRSHAGHESQAWRVVREPTFFMDLIRGFATLACDDRVLLFMLF